MPDLHYRPIDSETAYAKINLALHVRSRLPNGYHELETIFAFLDSGDQLSVAEGDEISLTITGPCSAGLEAKDNLVMEAAMLLAERSGKRQDARLVLEKNLPLASGIGGGSADAAATLRLLNRYWELNYPVEILIEIASELGADVPACVESHACFGSGIGQNLQPVDLSSFQKAAALLVNPGKPISTADIFKKWDGVDRGAIVGVAPAEMIASGRNDLESIAVSAVPEIGDILEQLDKTKPRMARMSGSGATCFALYDTPVEAKKTETDIIKIYPSYWTMTGRLR